MFPLHCAVHIGPMSYMASTTNTVAQRTKKTPIGVERRSICWKSTEWNASLPC